MLDDKYKYKSDRIKPRMQLRSDICKHIESWSADSHRRIGDSFKELRETERKNEPPSPPMDWTRKPIKK